MNILEAIFNAIGAFLQAILGLIIDFFVALQRLLTSLLDAIGRLFGA